MPAYSAVVRAERTGTTPASDRPHVVMLLANPFTHDTRVYKEARALVTWACDVTIVARDGKDLPTQEVKDGIAIERVPFAEATLVGSLWLLVLLQLGAVRGVERLVHGRITGTADSDGSKQGWSLRRAVAWLLGFVAVLLGTVAGLVASLVRGLWRLSKWLVRTGVDGLRGGLHLVLVDFPVSFLNGLIVVARGVSTSAKGVLRFARSAAWAILRFFGQGFRILLPTRFYDRLARGVVRSLRRFETGLRWRYNRWEGGLTERSTPRRSFLNFTLAPLRWPSALPRVLERIQRRARRTYNLSRSRWIRWWTPKRRAMARRRTLLRSDLRKRVRAALPAQSPILAMNVPFARHAVRQKPDVLVAHDLNTLLAGLAVRKLTGCKLVYDSHELYLERNIGDRSRFKENLFWTPIERLAIGECDAVMSVAEGICRHLETRYQIPRPHLIRNVQPFEPPAERTDLLARSLGVPSQTRLGIYAGAITINRGIEQLIEAAQYLDPSTAFVIMGYSLNPAFLEGLRDQAKSLGVLDRTLYFHDAVPMDQVVEYVSSAHVSVVPTRNVCLSYYFEASNKIFHSLMAGVPVAMSDHPEKRTIVENHGVGVLFDETDPKNIARATLELLADEAAYRTMQENCIVAARTLNWEHEQYRLRLIYAGLLGASVPAIPEIEIPPVATAIA